MSESEFRQIAELRYLLEAHALKDSFLAGDIRWESRVIAAHPKLSTIETRLLNGEAANQHEWKRYDREFHYSLTSACGSISLLETYSETFDEFVRYQIIVLMLRGAPAAEEHGLLLECAWNRDHEQAKVVLREPASAPSVKFSQDLPPRDSLSPKVRRAFTWPRSRQTIFEKRPIFGSSSLSAGDKSQTFNLKRYDWEFHQAPIAACGSQILIHTQRAIFDKHTRYQMIALSDRGNIAAREHRALMECALPRDKGSACEVWERHIRGGVEEALRSDRIN